jgi:hypothetical protein
MHRGRTAESAPDMTAAPVEPAPDMTTAAVSTAAVSAAAGNRRLACEQKCQGDRQEDR